MGQSPGPRPPFQICLLLRAKLLTQGACSRRQGHARPRARELGLPLQLASAFPVSAKFAVCLSSTTTSNGVMFFGDGPYEISSGVDASARFKYTPLFVNPVSTAGSYIAGRNRSSTSLVFGPLRLTGQPCPSKSRCLASTRKGMEEPRLVRLLPILNCRPPSTRR
ncbi:basic 7S globulin-like [Iris pallida]|uniref:Basic 7S globulin-like n=1 Tax=Iris pallida TaxID=29817 RepID=A0AAX6DZ93_IRIPA|nr:basic 7S globulin-like [Iris pallida]